MKAYEARLAIIAVLGFAVASAICWFAGAKNLNATTISLSAVAGGVVAILAMVLSGAFVSGKRKRCAAEHRAVTAGPRTLLDRRYRFSFANEEFARRVAVQSMRD